MELEEWSRKRDERYTRKVELREEVEWKSREELFEGAQRGVGTIMKRNLTPGSGVG